MNPATMSGLTRRVSDQTKATIGDTKLKVASAVHKIQASTDKLEQAILTETPYWMTLNKITSDEWYKKCCTLADKFEEENINRQSPIMQDENQSDWRSLVYTAEKLQDPLRLFMEKIRDRVGGEQLEVHPAGLKGVERAIQKVEMDYDGNWRRLLDVCRGGVVHQSFEALYHILELLHEHHDNLFGFRVVRVKNRYKKPTYHGWADIHLLVEPVSMNSIFENNTNTDSIPPHHICEVQLSHITMWDKRKKSLLFGHKQYKMSRALDTKLKETAFKIGGVKGQKLMADYLEKTQEIRAAVQHSVFVQQTESKRNLWFYVDKKRALQLCSLYGIGMGFIIGCSLWKNDKMKWTTKIVPRERTVFGVGGIQMEKARGISYMVMGLANLCALNWLTPKEVNRILQADALCFGVWGIQNMYNAMAPHNFGRFTAEMWSNYIVCSFSASYAFLASRK